MTDNIDISIVIISFNTIDYTRECLQSVYDNLGAMSVQVIVVDNDSKDGSTDMVREEFPLAEMISNNDNLGFAAANNQAFDICTGRYVLLLNSDTVVLGDVLQQSMQYKGTSRWYCDGLRSQVVCRLCTYGTLAMI